MLTWGKVLRMVVRPIRNRPVQPDLTSSILLITSVNLMMYTNLI